MSFRYGFNKVAYITNACSSIRIAFMKKRFGSLGRSIQRSFDEEGELIRSDKAMYVAALRAKRAVVDLALCNNFDYFGTITVSDNNFDISSYEGQVCVLDSLLDALDNYRQNFSSDFRYVIVPEYGEKKGRLHFHFLIKGILKNDLFINENHYLDWNYMKLRFGHIQITRIKDTSNDRQRVAFYCSKYITKNSLQIRSHRYFASNDLKRPSKVCMDDLSASISLLDWLEEIGEAPYMKSSEIGCECYSLHFRMFYDWLQSEGQFIDRKNKCFSVPSCFGYRCDPFT